ncbi:iron chelate uptake ABC transporter family permease subunit [Pelistega sp. NLN82]|uniref:Iron chelate uptake ABC transporter family permease subunit n=1 Tax=Pelistega ratti TaxID=2652177 RepID=A0A6L9Y7V9_9BURK|nr:iron chelate uptake ABC transporter family permease subunit [Pelistega ratti]NEN75937.1 iron chelate uptake ABC transporter family permease subunit [Pelistega ratti]
MLKNKLFLLSGVLLGAIVLFMTLGANGQWAFILPFRGGKLFALLIVAYAVSVSTLLFQTITANRILTPYIMGFDTLYLLIQTLLIFILGAIAYSTLNIGFKFSIEVVLMLGASMVLFTSLFSKAHEDLYRMILTGVILGVLFRSINTFLQRMIDPEEYSVVQSVSFAQFNLIKTDLLPYSAVIIIVVSLLIWHSRYELDVIALGRDQAINLGINFKKRILFFLFLIAVLVAVSTALVGPITFLGLLVSGLTYEYFKTDRHSVLIPASFLIGAITLVLGQVIFEHFLGMKGVLSVVIEFIGGVAFILLLLRRKSL